jgi:hypothetical protein
MKIHNVFVKEVQSNAGEKNSKDLRPFPYQRLLTIVEPGIVINCMAMVY